MRLNKLTLKVTSALLVAGAATMTSPASATGIQGHIYTSQQAIPLLPSGRLRDILSMNQDYLMTGSYFPDSGYVARDAYGEMAHWEQFVEAYLQRVRQRYTPPFDSPDAARHVAFLMGAASHGMVDQTFDILFQDKCNHIDGNASELDTGIETWLVTDIGPRPNIGVRMYGGFLSDVFATGMGHPVDVSKMDFGMNTLKAAMFGVNGFLRFSHQIYRDKMPWANSHYLDGDLAGAYPFNALVVARYWELLWDRLNGVTTPEDVVAGETPEAGSTLWTLDADNMDSYVTLFVGYGLDPESVNQDTFYVTDPGGNRVPTRIRMRGDAWASTLQLQPLEDWRPDTTYTVVLTRGVETLNGAHPASDHWLWFTTGCPECRCAAIAYQHCGYGGYGVCLAPGLHKLPALAARGMRNDDISSIRVQPGHSVRLFEHDGFGGASVTLASDSSCFVSGGWNDRVSSIEIR